MRRPAAAEPLAEEMKCGALDGLARLAQPLLQPTQLLDNRRPLIGRECELAEQFQRPLIGENCAIQMAPLLVSVLESRGIQMPTDDGQLRFEMLDASEFFHAAYL